MLFKLCSALFHLKILLAKRGDFQADILLVYEEGKNSLSMCFLSLDQVLTLELASFILLQILIPQRRIAFHLENSQLERFVFITSLKFKYALNGL